jgi:hypothetical protein
LGKSSKSENPPGILNRVFSFSSPQAKTTENATDDPLEQALTRLKQAMGGQPVFRQGPCAIETQIDTE